MEEVEKPPLTSFSSRISTSTPFICRARPMLSLGDKTEKAVARASASRPVGAVTVTRRLPAIPSPVRGSRICEIQFVPTFRFWKSAPDVATARFRRRSRLELGNTSTFQADSPGGGSPARRSQERPSESARRPPTRGTGVESAANDGPVAPTARPRAPTSHRAASPRHTSAPAPRGTCANDGADAATRRGAAGVAHPRRAYSC